MVPVRAVRRQQEAGSSLGLVATGSDAGLSRVP